MFSIVKRYYSRGIYNTDDVGAFVRAGRLSMDEYQQITGKAYAE